MSQGYEKVNDTTVIRICDLDKEIAEATMKNEAKYVGEWMKCITHEYIRQKIVEAEAKGEKRVTLINQGWSRTLHGKINFPDIAKRHGILNKIRSFLDPSMIVCEWYLHENYEIIITWEEPSSCNIL